MKIFTIRRALLACAVALACVAPVYADTPAALMQPGADPEISAFIAKIRAVDNHSHANSIVRGDTDYDALPLDGVAIEMPAQLRLDNPDWIAAYKALYQYPYDDMSEAHMRVLRGAMQDVVREQREDFPTWVLNQVGTEVLLANRIAMGPGLMSPRFRWVSYADTLLLPLSTKAEAAVTPDREILYPLEEKLLRHYLSDLKIATLPATLDAYLEAVVTPTLEAQRNAGCVAIKFEAAYLRPLDFDAADAETAKRVYAQHIASGEPSHAEYKTLQDFLFRYIAREAGRLGMAVHIHSFEGFGPYYDVAGADPMLLEPAFNDPALRNTRFVIVHGGGMYAPQAGAMTWKPNVYVDFSLMTVVYPPEKVAGILRNWLTQFPEKVLYGSDAIALGPDMGWEVTAWVAASTARKALALALTEMMQAGEVSRARAEEIATMVLRTNAGTLYSLGLK